MPEQLPIEFPVPHHVSRAAQKHLSQRSARPTYPQGNDAAEWTEHIAEIDDDLREMIKGLVLPVAIEETSVDGVPTYVVRPQDEPADDPGPISLSFHGGALIYGGGDLVGIV